MAPCLLFKMQITSDSTTLGGAYAGYLGGIINSLFGGLTAIYVKDSGEAGFLRGDFSGTASGTTWGATGSLYPTAVVSNAGITPATLLSNLDTGFIYGNFKGSLGGHIDSRLWNTGTGNTKAIRGQDWGIYSLAFGIEPRAKNPASATTWTGRAYGEAAFGTFQISGDSYLPETGIWMTDEISGTLGSPVAGMMSSANYTGRFITPVMMGTMGGKFTGAYTGTDDQWLAISAGTWQKTQDLYYNGILDSNAWHDQHNHTYRTLAYQQDRHILGNAFYEWKAYDGTESGWSWLYNGSGQVTMKRYFFDGTVETWVYTLQGGYTPSDVSPFTWENNSLVSYSQGTYTISSTLAALLESYAPAGYTAQNWNDGYYLQTIGDFGDGPVLLGGLADIWTATPGAPASFVLAGDYGTYDDVGFMSGVYYSGINSANMYDTSWTIMNPADKSQNGSYFGFVTGKTDSDFNTYGMVTALYLDKSGNAGFLLGDYTGTVFPNADNDLFEAMGGLFPTQIKASTGYTAASLYTADSGGIVNDHYNSTPYQAEGIFYTNGTFATSSGIFMAGFRDANFASIGGSGWAMAVGATVRGGDYSSGSTDYWLLDWGTKTYAQTGHNMNPPFFDDNKRRSRGFAISNPDNADIGGQWSGSFIEGKSISSWINIDSGLNGLAFGEIHGTFDPSSSATYMTWETVTGSIAMDTNTFMALAGSAAGQVALQQMNLPAYAIGKTTMSGSIPVSGGNLGMTMTDVTFYAHSSGQQPMVWATNNVSGSFTGSPAAGNNGLLTGVQSPTLQTIVTINTWNSPAGIWTADVCPPGNANVNLVKNLDGGGTTQVQMYGQAGGAISGTTITGTAAGVNQPN